MPCQGLLIVPSLHLISRFCETAFAGCLESPVAAGGRGRRVRARGPLAHVGSEASDGYKRARSDARHEPEPIPADAGRNPYCFAAVLAPPLLAGAGADCAALGFGLQKSGSADANSLLT